MAKKGSIAKVSIDEGAGLVTFNFSNGRVTVVNPFDFTEDVQKRLTLHGTKQKLGDSYAGADSLADAIENFDRVFETMKNGQWSTRGEGGGGPVGSTVEAYRRVMISFKKAPADWSYDAAKESWGQHSDEIKKAIRVTPEFVGELSIIAKEKAASNKSIEEILGAVTVAA